MKRDTIATGEALSSHKVELALFDAVTLLGGPTRFMAALGIDKHKFGALLSGAEGLGPEMALQIEAATQGLVPAMSVLPSLPATMDEFEQGFLDLQQKFREACERPGMRTWRAAVEASDRLKAVADRL